MEFFRRTTHINFMALRRWTALFSVLVFVFSIFFLWHDGLHLGLDFTGGSQVELSFDKVANLPLIRQALNQHGIKRAVVQHYGHSQEVLLTLPPQSQSTQASLAKLLKIALPKAQIQSINYVGPQVGKELAISGLLALIFALMGTMLYILFRFEYRFAVSAALALIHDPVLVLGVFAFTGMEFNLISLGALLAMLGYSLNDTVVVFDRVRENFRKVRQTTNLEIMNLSINQTLSRTVLTSGLTLLVVIALLLYGGETLRGFSITLLIGILIGTYSSIYVAGALALSLGLKREDFIPMSKKVVDENP